MMAQVRQATPDDAHAIASVRVPTWQAAYRGIVPDSYLDAMDIDASADRTRRWLSDPTSPGVDLLIEEADQVVGWSHARIPTRDEGEEPTVAEVAAIYVLPEHWGRGFGRLLLDASIDWLRARGATALCIWVLQDNDRGRAFYERTGFALDGGRKPVELVPHSEIWELRYRRSL
jgi:GNAT superfamily N-acetyltransferase